MGGMIRVQSSRGSDSVREEGKEKKRREAGG